MAKELPYFQFEPAQYLTGNIQFCDLEVQGLFLNICCIYWQRSCQLSLEQLQRKFDKKELINVLISENILKVEKGNVIIEFLVEQFETITKSKLTLSEAGRKGGLSSAKARLEAKGKHKIKEKKRKEDNKIEEEKKKTEVFERWWDFYDKKVNKVDALKIWLKIDSKDFDAIIDHTIPYVQSKPDKQYRKDPTTYLNGKHWNDEIILTNPNNLTNGFKPTNTTRAEEVSKLKQAAAQLLKGTVFDNGNP